MTETNLQNYDVTSRANTATTKADLNTENPFTSHRSRSRLTQATRWAADCVTWELSCWLTALVTRDQMRTDFGISIQQMLLDELYSWTFISTPIFFISLAPRSKPSIPNDFVWTPVKFLGLRTFFNWSVLYTVSRQFLQQCVQKLSDSTIHAKIISTFFSATWSRSCIIRSHQGFRAGTNTRKFEIVFCGNPRLEVVVNKQASQIYSVLYHDILLTISQQNIW